MPEAADSFPPPQQSEDNTDTGHPMPTCDKLSFGDNHGLNRGTQHQLRAGVSSGFKTLDVLLDTARFPARVAGGAGQVQHVLLHFVERNLLMNGKDSLYGLMHRAGERYRLDEHVQSCDYSASPS